MILKQLIAEINASLKDYATKFPSYRDIPAKRRNDIVKIRRILMLPNPIVICEKLNDYLEDLKIPILYWLPFVDVNDFYWGIKNVLLKGEYQEVNLLKVLLTEKDLLIKDYRERILSGQYSDQSVEHKINELAMELKLLRNENSYLYSTVMSLDQKISSLESECKENFHRAITAEDKLQCLQNKYDELVHLDKGPNGSYSSISSDSYTGAYRVYSC